MFSLRSKNGPKIIPNQYQNGPKLYQKWTQNCPKSTPKWSKNVSKMVPRLSANGPEGSQNAFKVVQTRSWNSPHLLYLSKLISNLHLSFSNLASIKLALINNLFLYFSITNKYSISSRLQLSSRFTWPRLRQEQPVIHSPTHEHSHTCVLPSTPKH